MTTMGSLENHSIIVGGGANRVAINLKQMPNDNPSSMAMTSILIEIGDVEIQIRRLNRFAEQARFKELPSINNGQRKSQQKNEITDRPNYWDYSSEYGPKMWSRIFPEIQMKKFQSPIRIYTDQSEYEPELNRRPFIIEVDENCCQNLENTGKSFQVSGNNSSRITGGPVSDEYQFLQFHMHWGSNDLEGSEHVIDGVRYPAELHIVTWNVSRYKTPQAAAASENFDGLMVFGILFKIQPMDNPDLTPLLNLFTKITYKGEKINLNDGAIFLGNLFPKDIQNYYTYDGSLTTPMCDESVRWIIFRERMGLSRAQFDQLRQLKQTCKGESSAHCNIEDNFRPVMPLNGRIVYRSFP